MKKRTTPFTVILVIFFGIGVIYFGAAVGAAVDLTADDNGKIVLGDINIDSTITNVDLILAQITDRDTKCFQFSAIALFAYTLFIITQSMNRLRLHRKGIEHGSARWAYDNEKIKLADKKKKAPYIQLTEPDGTPIIKTIRIPILKKDILPRKQKARIDNNMILTNDVLLSLNTRQHMKNLNVLVVGGSGSGKTFFYGKPNILQLNTSFVITDPKGEILQSTGILLSQAGYNVRVFNLINMAHSHNYNPFDYVYDEYIDENGEEQKKLNDSYVIKMVNVLMKNTKKDNMSGGDQFWDDSASALITAISFYLLEEGGKSEQNFGTVIKMLKLVEIDMNDNTKESELDKKFRILKEKRPQSMAVSYYTDFKKAPPETAMSIVMSCNVRLQTFNIPEVDNLTHTDTIMLNELGDRKSALFVIIPASDATFNFLAAMMYTQLFDTLYNRANFKYGGRLPVHVRCILDEFANLGQIPDFEKLLATMRSMEISANVILQNISQLKKLYEKSWEDIKGNCDSFLFLGGQEMSTLEEVSKSLGKETIDLKSSNRTKSARNNSTAENNSILGRELLQPDELMRMDAQKCVLIVNREPPFFCRKFDIFKHPNYKFLGDADKNNVFKYSSIVTLKNPNNQLTPEEKEELTADYYSEPFEEGEEIIISNADEPEKPMHRVNKELQKTIHDGKVTRITGNTTITSETLKEMKPPEEDVFEGNHEANVFFSDELSNFDDDVITSLSNCVFVPDFKYGKEGESNNETDSTHHITSESLSLSDMDDKVVHGDKNQSFIFNDSISSLENDVSLPGISGMSVISSFMTTIKNSADEYDYAAT